MLFGLVLTYSNIVSVALMKLCLCGKNCVVVSMTNTTRADVWVIVILGILVVYLVWLYCVVWL